MIIELAGASGVGKSTCLSKISEPLFSHSQVVSGALLKNLMIQARKSNHEHFFMMLADRNNIFKSPDFTTKIIARINDFDSFDSKKFNLIKLIDLHRQDFLVRQAVQAKHLLVDEGFVHASYPFSQISENFASDVDFFISNIPLPDLVIQLHVTPDRLFKRIKARGKVVNSYRYASDEKLLKRLECVEPYLDIMARVLERRGCPVLHVDANRPVKEWSLDLLNIVKNKVTNFGACDTAASSIEFDFTGTLPTRLPEVPLNLKF